ncbi:hypothetical protein LSB85_003676 [Salmonella enterica]|nr:hypothetical protein [Salmonella enterica]
MMTNAQLRRQYAQRKASKKKTSHDLASHQCTVSITGVLHVDEQRKPCARYCYINVWRSAGAGHQMQGVLRLYTCDATRHQIGRLAPGTPVVIGGLSLKKAGRKKLIQTTPGTIITLLTGNGE